MSTLLHFIKRDSSGKAKFGQQVQRKKTTTKKKRKVTFTEQNNNNELKSPETSLPDQDFSNHSSLTSSPNNRVENLRVQFKDLYLTESILREGSERDDMEFLNTTTDESDLEYEKIGKVINRNLELEKYSSYRGKLSEIHGLSSSRIKNEVCTNLRDTIIDELDLKKRTDQDEEKMKTEFNEPEYLIKKSNFYDNDEPLDNEDEHFGDKLEKFQEVIEFDITKKAIEIFLRMLKSPNSLGSRNNDNNNFLTQDPSTTRASVPLLSPAYIFKYLRQSRGVDFLERNCRREGKCFSILTSAKTSQKGTKKTPEFILREFLLPHEETEVEKSGRYFHQRKMCWLCNVFITNKLRSVLDKKERKKINWKNLSELYPELLQFFKSPEGSVTFLIQDHGVTTEETKNQIDGSYYSFEVVLPPSVETGLLLPFRKFPTTLNITTEEMEIGNGIRGSIYRYEDTEAQNFH